MISNTFIFTVFGFGVFFLCLSIGIHFYNQYKNKKNGSNNFYSTQKVESDKYSVFYQKSYVRLKKVPLLGKQILNVRLRLLSINQYDERTLRKETMKITFRVLLIMFVAVFVIAVVSQSFMAILFALMGALIANRILINLFVKKIEDRILVQFSNFLDDNRHEFQDTKSVDEAMYRAAQGTHHDIKMQLDRIHRILVSKDPRKGLESFYNVAPNRYLKIYAGVSHLVMEYGDRVVSKGSMYLNSLSKLVRDIREDILRRRILRKKLNSFNFWALIPILFTFLIVWWAGTFFPVMKPIYGGTIGYITRIIVYGISILCFLMVQKLSELEEQHYAGSISRKIWEKKVYEWPWCRKVIDKITPSRRTTKYYNISLLLKEANSPLTVEWFYIQRIVVSLTCFLVIIGFSVFLHWNSAQHVRNDLTTSPNSIAGYMTENEESEAKKLTDFDNQVINNLKGVGAISRTIIQEQVENLSPYQMDASQLNSTINRITEKLQILNNAYLKWWEVLIAIAIACTAFQIPVWVLRFQRKMRAMEMQTEVDQFQTIISILCELDRVSVQMVLEWMERYSNIFKEPIQKCINSYDRGAERAVQQLIEDAPFPSFVRIIKRLKRAIEKIPLKEAFDDLEMQQEFHRAQKDERMKTLINSRIFYGNIFGWTPIGALLLLFLLFPMFYAVFTKMNELMYNLQHLN